MSAGTYSLGRRGGVFEIRAESEVAWRVSAAEEEGSAFDVFEKAISYTLQRARGADAEIRIYGRGGELTQTIRIDNSVFSPH